jgi:hypothetical protein
MTSGATHLRYATADQALAAVEHLLSPSRESAEPTVVLRTSRPAAAPAGRLRSTVWISVLLAFVLALVVLRVEPFAGWSEAMAEQIRRLAR